MTTWGDNPVKHVDPYNKPRERGNMKRRIGLALTAMILAVGAAIPFMSTAHAVTGMDECVNGTECLWAYNGGPEILVGSPGGVNNLFYNISNGNTDYVNIEFVGQGSYVGWCVGDAGDNEYTAAAGLVGGCGGSGIGWGGNFTVRSCNNNDGLEFYNVHNEGWLIPDNPNNGAGWELDGPEPQCLKFVD